MNRKHAIGILTALVILTILGLLWSDGAFGLSNHVAAMTYTGMAST